MKKLASKVFALSLSCAMMLSVVACNRSTQPTTETSGATATGEQTDAQGTSQVGGQLIIGAETDMDDNIMAGWNNSATNAEARGLMDDDYLTIDRNGKPVVNENFGTVEHKRNDDGTITYTVKIKEGVKWSDGQPLTALDYMTGVLVVNSKEMAAIDGFKTVGYTNYVGGEEYHEKGGKFKGFHLIDDYTFQGTLLPESGEEYYWRENLGTAVLPKHVIAPDAQIKDDGDGVYFEKGFENIDLEKTMNDKNTGFRYTYTPSLGAYKFDSFDRTTRLFTAKINEFYPGTYDGKKPNIETIVIKKVVSDTMLDELKAGSVDLLRGIISGEKIEAGLKLESENPNLIKDVSYDRAGYGNLTLVCDFGPTKSKHVRRAIAYAMDREDFAKSITRGHGTVLSGFYGLGLPEYKENKDIIDTELNNYPYNPEMAVKELEEDGWIYDEQGNEYQQKPDAVRYKKDENGKLVPLVIEWAAISNNEVSTLIKTKLIPAAMEVGMKINDSTFDFPVILEMRRRSGNFKEPKYHMFNGGTGFPSGHLYAWYWFGSEYKGTYNSNFIDDEELDKAGKALRNSKSDEEWSKNFVEYQKVWNDLMPNIPLYANVMNDFYSAKIENYSANDIQPLLYTVVDAKIAA